MANKRFRLTADYIELNALLKLLGLVPSGGEAKRLIGAGLVSVDGLAETRIRRKLRAGQTVRVGDETVHVVAE